MNYAMITSELIAVKVASDWKFPASQAAVYQYGVGLIKRETTSARWPGRLIVAASSARLRA
jgi:hypothetical protein